MNITLNNGVEIPMFWLDIFKSQERKICILPVERFLNWVSHDMKLPTEMGIE